MGGLVNLFAAFLQISSQQVSGVCLCLLSHGCLLSSLCLYRSAALDSTESRMENAGVSVCHAAATDSPMSAMSVQGTVWLVYTNTCTHTHLHTRALTTKGSGTASL